MVRELSDSIWVHSPTTPRNEPFFLLVLPSTPHHFARRRMNQTDYDFLQPAIHLNWYMNVCGYTESRCLSAQGVAYFQNGLNPLDCHYAATGSQPTTWQWLDAQDPTVGVSQQYTGPAFFLPSILLIAERLTFLWFYSCTQMATTPAVQRRFSIAG